MDPALIAVSYIFFCFLFVTGLRALILKMGTSQSHPIFLALQELLLSKNLKIKKSTLERFLNECNTVAPWFAVYGSLTVDCWDRLGKDLDLAWDQGTLKGGVKPIWKLVRGCLEDKKML